MLEAEETANVVEWDKAGLPTAARSISGRAIVASSLIHRRFLRDLEAVGRGEDPKAVIRDATQPLYPGAREYRRLCKSSNEGGHRDMELKSVTASL